MPGRKTITTISRLCAAAGAAAIALGSTYALAQPTTVDEIDVVAKPAKGPPETFSYPVGYSDLDLRTKEGFAELYNRVQIAADYACKKMDEPDDACRPAATRAAMAKARAAQHEIRAHGKHAAPGYQWVPPPHR